VKDFYNQLAVYVQPSVTEAFGIETLEAMAYGIPVICSSGAGSADCIEDGVSGFVVPPRDPKALLEKINLLYENPEIWESMSKAARIRSAKFRWPNIKQTYVDFWREHAPVEIGDEKI
jgi:glycosyltransferase involved in cell wall biosynthesis